MEPTLITLGVPFTMGQNGVRWTLGIIANGQNFYFEWLPGDTIITPLPVKHYVAVNAGTWFSDTVDYILWPSTRRIGISQTRNTSTALNNFALVPKERISSGRRGTIFQVNF